MLRVGPPRTPPALSPGHDVFRLGSLVTAVTPFLTGTRDRGVTGPAGTVQGVPNGDNHPGTHPAPGPDRTQARAPAVHDRVPRIDKGASHPRSCRAVGATDCAATYARYCHGGGSPCDYAEWIRLIRNWGKGAGAWCRSRMSLWRCGGCSVSSLPLSVRRRG